MPARALVLRAALPLTLPLRRGARLAHPARRTSFLHSHLSASSKPFVSSRQDSFNMRESRSGSARRPAAAAAAAKAVASYEAAGCSDAGSIKPPGRGRVSAACAKIPTPAKNAMDTDTSTKKRAATTAAAGGGDAGSVKPPKRGGREPSASAAARAETPTPKPAEGGTAKIEMEMEKKTNTSGTKRRAPAAAKAAAMTDIEDLAAVHPGGVLRFAPRLPPGGPRVVPLLKLKI